MRHKLAAAILIAFAAIFARGMSRADETITLPRRLRSKNSGLLAHILPEFTRGTGVSVRVG